MYAEAVKTIARFTSNACRLSQCENHEQQKNKPEVFLYNKP